MNARRCHQTAVCLLFSLLALASVESKKKPGATGGGAPGNPGSAQPAAAAAARQGGGGKGAGLPGAGDRVARAGLEFELSQVALRKQLGNEWVGSRAAKGGVYLVIDWAYKNVSGKPMSAFSQPELVLISPDGTEYEEDVGATATHATEVDIDEKILSNLNPGITVQTAAVFEVAEELIAKDGWLAHIRFGGEEVVFRLETAEPEKAGGGGTARAGDGEDSPGGDRLAGSGAPAARTVADDAAAEAADREEEGSARLAELKGELAAIDAKIASERARWQQALDTINRLTNYKKTPVREGSQEYQRCLAASGVIQEVESGAAELKQEKARLEAMIGELEE